MGIFDRKHLHKADTVPDWEKIPEEQWTAVQRRAAETNGWDTPGNRESAKGFGATTLALGMLATGRPWLTALSIVPMGWGRWKDIKDGRVATETLTRGPRGEFVDAAIDKIVTFGALGVGLARSFITATEAVYVGAQQGANVLLASIAKRRGRENHPGRSGKYGMFALWAGIGIKVVGQAAELFGNEPIAHAAKNIGHIALMTGMAVGAVSTVTEYGPAAFGRSIPEQAAPEISEPTE